MKHYLMQKYGALLGLLALASFVLAFTLAPTSCSSLTPEQQQRLQTITVPATALGLAYAQSQGYISPGDRITLTQGVAIVVSDKTPEAKLFDLAELGLKDAMANGLLCPGDVVTVGTDTADITSDPGPVNPLLPPLPSQGQEKSKK
jgi:hypothetical protein